VRENRRQYLESAQDDELRDRGLKLEVAEQPAKYFSLNFGIYDQDIDECFS
jgi:hypothetical protein